MVQSLFYIFQIPWTKLKTTPITIVSDFFYIAYSWLYYNFALTLW